VSDSGHDAQVRRFLTIGMLACIGCNAELGPRPGTTTDASGGNNTDAPINTPDSPTTIDAPMCFNGRVVYLNFEGQTLTDAAASDATQNRASWMNIATGTAPAFRAASGTRAADIMEITDGIRTQLAEFPISVVTSRPATGPYVMIVFGGTAQQVGSMYGLAVNQLDCDDSEKSDVAWISDAPALSNQAVINTAIGAIGFGLGLTATTDPGDCMCAWGNTCQPQTAAACTLSTNIARDQQSTLLCPAAPATQDEKAAFTQAFCQ
jgi:hypothetical protein